MRKVLALALTFLLLAQSVWAALTLVDITPHQQDALADPWNFTQTTTAGVNLYLIPCASSNVVDLIVAGTHNGDALSEAVTFSTQAHAAIWYRQNPDIGIGLPISMDLSPDTDDGGCVSLGFSGAKATTPLTDPQSTSGASVTSATLSVTCPTGGIVISAISLSAISSGNSVAPTETGQTSLMHEDDGAGEYMFSQRPGQGGATAMSYSWTGARSYGHVAVCVNAEPDATSFGPLRRRGQ